MRHRITIRTTDELSEVLRETQHATGRSKISAVVRDALELYDLVLQSILQGKHIYIGDCREIAGEVLLPHLEHARKNHHISSNNKEY